MRYGMEAGIRDSGLLFEVDRVRFEAYSFESSLGALVGRLCVRL